MSLVLEALKKLDREKGRTERGFVVMAAAPWPTRTASRWPAWAALAVATAGAIAAVVALRTAPAPVAAPAAPAAAAASPVLTAPPSSSPAATTVPRPTPRPALAAAKPVGAPAAAASPAVVPPAVVPELRLQAITERDGQPIAIINDHLVRVGDEIGDMRVLAIRGTEVDVEVRGQRTTLRF